MKIRVLEKKNLSYVLGAVLARSLIDLLSSFLAALSLKGRNVCTWTNITLKKKKKKIENNIFCILSLADYSGSIPTEAEHRAPEEHIKQCNKAQQ